MKRLVIALVILGAGLTANAAAPPLREEAPDLNALLKQRPGVTAEVSRRYELDRDNLRRTYPIAHSPARLKRLMRFNLAWQAAIDKYAPANPTKEDKDDLDALKKTIREDRDELLSQARVRDEVAPLLPFADALIDLEEARRRFDPIDPVKAAARVHALGKRIADVRQAIDAGKLPAPGVTARRAADVLGMHRTHLQRWFDFYNGYDPMFTWWLAEPYKDADAAIGKYQTFLRDQGKKAEKDAKKVDGTKGAVPLFADLKADPADLPSFADFEAPISEMRAVIRRFQSDRARIGGLAAAGFPGRGGRGSATAARRLSFARAWIRGLEKLDFDALGDDARIDYLLLRNQLQRDVDRAALEAKDVKRPTPPRDASGITGRPIGREALLLELAGEMIPYSPEQLVVLANKEFAWCEAEMKKATKEMGFDDWRQGLEKVKTLHVEPGKQPGVIRDLAFEAIAYLKKHDLVTVPPLAAETWRMEMMSPARQLISPFFLGGEVIQVAFPTNTMGHESKLQSLRGNNVHFSRATVHHELIPGHHLQGFMTPRYRSYRASFTTPFWIEGMALYWEFVLYDKGFPKTPEDRVGFLFWRMHRCARIIFSLGYHLGTMTPQQCIDLLVDRVGHERENATAEVRRSFGGSYGPLYQAAYMLGGMQLYALRKDLVGTGKMTERDFHDAILKENRIPIAMVRASLTKQKLTRDHVAEWKFFGEISTEGATGSR